MMPPDRNMQFSNVETAFAPTLEHMPEINCRRPGIPRLTAKPGHAYPNVLLVVPTLNEEQGLPVVLTQARQLGIATIVADAGSTDGTCEIAKEFKADILKVARGKGRGWREFLSRVDYTSWEYLAMVDGDDTYDLLALPRMLERDADMIIGRRMSLPEATSWIRGAGDGLLSFTASLFAGCRCPDLLSGFRLMRTSCLRELTLVSDNFELETELTLRFIRHGFSVEWVETEYRPRLGLSKLHAFKDGWSILNAILRFGMSKQ